MKDVIIGKGRLAGKGVYAARDFKKGEIVKYWNLQELSQAEFDALPKEEHMFVHSFWRKIYLFPEPSRYTNHSANPNTIADFIKMRDTARRPIKKGEMITNNATLEVRMELETFVPVYEKCKINNFKWLRGRYRNAVVCYTLPDGQEKNLTLKRARGSWQVIEESFSKD